jgi:acyl-CoA hydrolase
MNHILIAPRGTPGWRPRAQAVEESSAMEGKRVNESSVVTSLLINPQDANLSGFVHGGVIMYMIDNTAGAVALRHARCNVVTASIDRLEFHDPVMIGDLVTLQASVNYVGRTSLEVGVRVEAENLVSGKRRHTSSAYLTFVAIDAEGNPMALPPLIQETPEDLRRYREAGERRKNRMAEKRKEKQGQDLATRVESDSIPPVEQGRRLA